MIPFEQFEQDMKINKAGSDADSELSKTDGRFGVATPLPKSAKLKAANLLATAAAIGQVEIARLDEIQYLYAKSLLEEAGFDVKVTKVFDSASQKVLNYVLQATRREVTEMLTETEMKTNPAMAALNLAIVADDYGKNMKVGPGNMRTMTFPEFPKDWGQDQILAAFEGVEVIRVTGLVGRTDKSKVRTAFAKAGFVLQEGILPGDQEGTLSGDMVGVKNPAANERDFHCLLALAEEQDDRMKFTFKA